MVSWYDFFEPKVKVWEARGDVTKLIAGLTDQDLEVRCLAYDALGRLRNQQTSRTITDLLRKEDAAPARSRGAIALGRIGGGESVITLCDLLTDEDGEVRASAVRGLSQQLEPEMYSIFCAMLEDEYEGVVVGSIHALSRLGNYRAVTSLHRLFDRLDRELRDLASMAINSINLSQPLDDPADEVYFFTYASRGRLYCECYSYRLVAWRNYLRRRWQYPFARDWGVGFWEITTLPEHVKAKVMRPGHQLEMCDLRA